MAENRQEVIERERSFHNSRFNHEEDPRRYLDKWYDTIRHGAEAQDRFVRSEASRADVLEYGCADGELSINRLALPEVCHSLTGIDISDVAVNKANTRALRAGFSNAHFLAMNAEAMTFPDNSFDLVYGRGIIHHLDLDKCFSELARVLRCGRSASFFEPLGHNPVLNAYRKRTPDIRTRDEHPLLTSDFLIARKYFEATRIEYFGLFSVGSGLMPASMRNLVYKAGKCVDSLVLKVPFVNRCAWYALVTLTKKAQ
jgi:SAM-dependent methyltransferase